MKVRVNMKKVRSNVKVLNFDLSVSFLAFLTSFIIQIKPLTTKANGSHAFGDCGTSGYNNSNRIGKKDDNIHVYMLSSAYSGTMLQLL